MTILIVKEKFILVHRFHRLLLCGVWKTGLTHSTLCFCVKLDAMVPNWCIASHPTRIQNVQTKYPTNKREIKLFQLMCILN